jgi:hypothetical protein
MNARTLALLVLLPGLVLAPGYAAEESRQKQDTPPAMEAPPGMVIDPGDDPLMVDIPCEQISDATAKAACWEALTRRFEYFRQGMDHRAKTFRWQHFSTRVIFVSVLILVSVGLYFSYLQFRMYLREPQDAARRTGGKGERESMDSNLELSTGGIKVSSNVLGVIILALSLAFFYLYLVYVFPISETF